MQKNVFYGILFALVTVLQTPLVQAGAWTQAQGGYELIFPVTYYKTDEAFDRGGNKQAIKSYRKVAFEPWLEYGYYDNLTFGAQPSFQHASQAEESAATLQSLALFSRYRLYQNKTYGTVVSVQPWIKLAGAYKAQDENLLGDRQTDAEGRVLLGQSFPLFGQYHFVNIEAAYRLRTGAPSDELHIDSTLGIRPHEKLLFMLQYFHTHSTQSTNSVVRVSNSNDFKQDTLQLSAVVPVYQSISVQLGGFYYAKGENVGSGSGLLFSLMSKF